jgi:hypothetical protein
VKALSFVWAAASVQRIVNELVPTAVGVPEMMPVDEARDSPAGRDPATTDHV